MSITYPHDRPIPHDGLAEIPHEEPFVPVYARTRRGARSSKGGVKTWMIMAPIGVLVLGAGAAALVMGEREAVAPAPLAEPAATAPVLPAQPLVTETAPAATPSNVSIEVTPEPVVRAAPAPVRRAAPAPAARRAAPAPAPATREAPAEPTGPQPYTSSLNTTPPATTAPATPAPTPAPPPVIVIDPAG